jgi:hypothetical protein
VADSRGAGIYCKEHLIAKAREDGMKPAPPAPTYRKVNVDGQSTLVHRHVMAKIIGRPLTDDENVHHINGVRDDNRPENLELWSSSQPAGQRIPDKVAWAVEILRRYAPEHLRDP